MIDYKLYKYKKPTKQQVTQALLDNKGIMTEAAIALKVPVHYIRNMKNRHPEMQQIIDEAKEEFFDIGKNSLLKNVLEGKEASTIFLLKILGRHYGWAEADQSSNDVQTNVIYSPTYVSVNNEH